MWLMLMLAVTGSLGAPRPFADARLLLDRRLETLRRLLPDGPTPAADQALLRELAQSAHLRAFEARARPPVESGGAGETAFDVTASGRFEEIERFFRQLALSHRLVDVDALALTGTPGAVRLTALLRLPHRPLRAPLPAPPDGARAPLAGAPRPQADAYLHDQALALAKSETIAAWRRARRNPRLFLSELGAVVRDRPVVLSFAELRPAVADQGATPPRGDHEFVVRGLTLGDGPARALESRFERGFFRLSDFLMVRQGGCVRFEARGRSPVAGAEAALPLPSDDPFVQDDTPCRVDRDGDGARGVNAKAGANLKGTGGGPLTLRLRDVDLADVFFALHTLTGAGFLVDGDVAGRASVEFNRTTLPEALEALQKAAGLRLGTAGSLTRVAVDRKAALAPVAAGGGAPPISFALKRADVRDVLALMSEADAGYAALGPPGFLGRASLWLRNASLPDVRALVLASAGLGERLDDEGRRLLERAGGDEAPVPVAATAAAERRLELGPHELAVVEFELAGVGLGAEGSVAFAYSPTGTLLAYRPGDPLADGKLREVQSTDVLVDTDDGPLRLLVPPLK